MEPAAAAEEDAGTLLAALLRPVAPQASGALAERLLAQLGSLSAVLAAEAGTLETILPDEPASARFLRLIRATMLDALRSRALLEPVISDGRALIDYLHAELAESRIELFRVLFLDCSNRLLGDEVLSRGSIREARVYPREIMRRALQLGATAVILVHNHPSGDPAPSPADVRLTERIIEAGKTMDVRVHDHLIIARSGWVSFKQEGLL